MKKKKEVYTTEIIAELKKVEQMVQELKQDSTELELWAKNKTNETCCKINCSILTPLLSITYNPDSIVYQNIVSLLEAEAYQLKKQLKESLDIGDNTHWECE